MVRLDFSRDNRSKWRHENALFSPGTFSNLAEGATITVGVNAFQVNYESGDGNDLTLTVAP
jgi:hypothetical protein